MKQHIKEFLKSLLSRKFLIFVIATVLMFMKIIQDSTWIWVVGIYLGANTLESIGTTLKDNLTKKE